MGQQTNDWNNFKLGTGDDDALDFTLASDTVNTICWMCQHDSLIIGTVDSEWTLSASSSDAALTASNIKVKRQSVYGSSGVAAQMVGEVVLFVQRQGRKVREFVYTWEKDGYVSPDLTIIADHITKSGIRETALQQQPDSILWCVLEDGGIAALTYERDQEVVGWQKYVTDGRFLSVAVLPEGGEDVVYVAVERGAGVLIERFAPRKYETIANAVFTDSSVIVEGEAIETVTGLGHLEGKTVQVLADGAVQTEKVVEDGQIVLDSPASVVCVGLPFESLLSPMPIEIEMQNGSSVLRTKGVGELRIRVYGSVGGEVRAGDGEWQAIISRSIEGDNVNSAITPKDEVVVINPVGGWGRTTEIKIRQRDPLPLNISVVVAVCEVVE